MLTTNPGARLRRNPGLRPLAVLALLLALLVPLAPATQARPQPQATSPDRCFPATGFTVANDAFWSYFTHRGGIETFGYPISREFQFLGFRTQFFQRLIMQQQADGSVTTLNLLQEDLMPYTQINGSTFPAPDPAVADAAPQPGSPTYGQEVIQFVEEMAPDEWNGLAVRFNETFQSAVSYEEAFPNGEGDPSLMPLVNLEIWGVPVSRPAFDPNNRSFVYQRFQRGIMHYDDTCRCTQGLLLADYFKAILTGQNLPPDLAAQARDSRFLNQYDNSKPNGVARPWQLPETNMLGAFEPDNGQPGAPFPQQRPAATPAPTFAPLAPTPLPTVAAQPRAEPGDTERPQIDIVSPAPGSTFSDRVDIVVDPFDNEAVDRVRVEARWDGNDWRRLADISKDDDWAFVWNVGDLREQRDVEVRAYAVDEAGNRSRREVVSGLIIDHSPPDLNLEEPASGAGIARDQTIEVRGWAKDGWSSVSSVDVLIDGRPVARAEYGLQRDDLGGRFGFRSSLDPRRLGLEDGEHELSVRAVDAAGNVAVSQRVTLTTSAVGAAATSRLVLAIDTPGAGAMVSDHVVVAGAAFNRDARQGSGVDRVEVFFDGGPDGGRPIATATLGAPRPDLTDRWGQASANSGWFAEFDLPADGREHTITVVAHGDNGQREASRSVVASDRTRIALQQPPPGQPLDVDLAGPAGSTPIFGYALQLGTQGDTGVSDVQVWVDGPLGVGRQLEVKYGGERRMVADQFGRQYLRSGWSVLWDPDLMSQFARATEGREQVHTLFVYARTAEGWVYSSSILRLR